VNLGQSGSPVLALNSHAVVGLVEGRWLRSSAVSIAKSSSRSPSTPGAAVPIRSDDLSRCKLGAFGAAFLSPGNLATCKT
jgi:hypothetical protein